MTDQDSSARSDIAALRADRDSLAKALTDLVPVVEYISGDLNTSAWRALEFARHVLSEKQPVRPLAWTDDRCVELEELGLLLHEAASINHGSNCLERIQRCIALAEKLGRDDLFKCRDSLHNFLRGLAIADRSHEQSRFDPTMKGEA